MDGFLADLRRGMGEVGKQASTHRRPKAWHKGSSSEPNKFCKKRKEAMFLVL